MKKLIIALCLFFAFFMLGCKKSDLNNDEIEVLNALNECRIFYQDIDNENSVTKDISFSTPSNSNVKCDIEISDENVVSKAGRINRSNEDKKVNVTFVVYLNDAKYEKTFNLTIIKSEDSASGEENGNGEDNGNNNSGTEDNGEGGEGGENNQEEDDGILASADFTGLEKGATPIIDGWTLNVNKKGAYDTGWLSLRNDGEYVISSTFACKEEAIIVSFKYYMNNIGSTGSSSSKIKFEALDKDDNVVDEFLIPELNQLASVETSGNTKYAKTLNVMMKAEGVVKVKITFVKDGGGNIGFGSIIIEAKKIVE